MSKTFDKLKISELIIIYERLLMKLNDYTPDTIDYSIVEEKLDAMAKIIQEKKPSYFLSQSQKEDKAFIEGVLAENYELEYVAQMFNVSRQTIYNWIKQKKIKVIKIGRKPYIPKTEVDKISKSGTYET